MRQEVLKQKQKNEDLKKQMEELEQKTAEKGTTLVQMKRNLDREHATIANLRKQLVQKATNKSNAQVRRTWTIHLQDVIKEEEEKTEQEVSQKHQQEINDLKRQHWEEQKRLQRRVETLRLSDLSVDDLRPIF